MKSRFLGSIALALLMACDTITESDIRVDFRTDRATYSIGEEGSVRLTNLGTAPLRVWSPLLNLCGAIFMDRLDGLEWKDVPSPLVYGIPCPLSYIQLIRPGESFQTRFDLSDEYFVHAGDYRFRVERDGPVPLVSESFTVD